MANELVKIQFHGDELEAVALDGGNFRTSLRRICENIGLAFSAQLQKLKKKSWACVSEIDTHDTSGRVQSMVMIDRRTLVMWLANIDERKVKDSVREKIRRYQAECAEVLDRHFGARVSAASQEQYHSDPLLNEMLRVQAQMTSSMPLLIETRRRQIEAERLQSQMVQHLWEAHQLARSATATAQAALHQSTSNHGYFTVLGYSRIRNREMPVTQAAAHGKKLTALCNSRGIRTSTMTDPRFGVVNTYPETLLREYFGDSV
ncbi:hypothetical protein VT84_13750 [Gemmata sp. SH-PL17]|uniref:phage antirepressor N-terminal domain-containing protein n=1 Tax=Gemmata sp. SH-PL17 TaxID=1630693 RepID=UPI00078BFA1A|nr:phage antirepressor N-terminal domain-containing protein [Gemmata sp. SH-PL17]AMV25457.1 hypothetical protein VT84_13750 [Gemmata sp. SH-PL17]